MGDREGQRESKMRENRVIFRENDGKQSLSPEAFALRRGLARVCLVVDVLPSRPSPIRCPEN